MLAHLVENHDRVVAKTELLDEVLGDRFVSETTLTSRIKAARRAVGDDGTDQRVIRTVHGRGYRIVTPVTARSAPPGAGPSSPGGPVGRLLERDGALATLDDALDAARRGAGRVVFVAGEPGIGKTALLRSCADGARRPSRPPPPGQPGRSGTADRSDADPARLRHAPQAQAHGHALRRRGSRNHHHAVSALASRKWAVIANHPTL